jgi:hypothetical protein
MRWDIFVSHATEDKKEFVEPLVAKLISMGLRVWYDSYTLTIGDSLSQSIEQGIKDSKYAVIVLSQSFFVKKWTRMELNAFFSLERNDENTILPIWHNIGVDEIRTYSPLLADRVALTSQRGVDYIANEIYKKISGNKAELVRDEKYNRYKNQLKLRVNWGGGNYHKIIDDNLDYYCMSHSNYKYVKEKIKDLHEWGSGGEKKYEYSVLDENSSSLLMIEVIESYDTTSDDSMDYSYPTEIILNANLDFDKEPLDKLIKRINDPK